MTFAGWVSESKTRYQRQSAGVATKESLWALWRGAVRRTADQWVGQPWWERGDWDVLVVLDAMRVDLARDVIDEDAIAVWSPASTSIDWIERHFQPKYRPEYSRAGYVTANPFASHDEPDTQSADLDAKQVGYLDLVYERGFEDVGGIKTTPPEAVTDAAIHAWRSQDLDRLIVHYMQPHQPFRSRPDWEQETSNLENLVTDTEVGGPCIWQRCRRGELDPDAVWKAYRDNLEWVWHDVENRLLENIDGRVAITADHGNAIGEWGCWAHPPGTVVPAVRRVPWVSVDGRDNHTVTPDVDLGTAACNSERAVDEQLEALGYK
jgi:hypothetical protein